MPVFTDVYGGDLETDNDGSRAWMVQWSISDGQSEQNGSDWTTFLERCFELMAMDRPSYLYFHNLNYDGNFLKYPLLKFCEDNGFRMSVIKRVSSLISIQIIPPRNSGLSKLHIRDSMKKLYGSPPLYEVARLVGMEKLEGFEFHSGWSKSLDLKDSRNWDYVNMDARIVARAMNMVHNKGLVKATISGDAWNKLKWSIGPETFLCYYPHLNYETDSFLRNAYSGGINISQHKGINKGTITHADVNSMYPTVMYYDPLPCYEPVITNEEPSGLFVVKGLFKLRIRDGYIPWYQFRKAVDNALEDMKFGQSVTKCEHWHLLTITSVELDLLRKWYHVETAFDDAENPSIYYGFKSIKGVMRKHIDKYIKEKSMAMKGTLERDIPKVMMNSPYGRFGLNPESEDISLEWDGDMLIWKSTKSIMKNHDAYLPVAEFVTAHAKTRLLDYVAKCGCDRVIHCDTDSVIHYGGEVKGVDYGDDLGQWGIESRPVQIWEGGFKRYIEQLEPEINSLKSISMACAGVPNRKTSKNVPYGMWIELLDNPDKILSDDLLGCKDYCIRSKWIRELYHNHNMNPDKVNTMKLIPRHVPGGVILEERQHKLCDPLQFRWRH